MIKYLFIFCFGYCALPTFAQNVFNDLPIPQGACLPCERVTLFTRAKDIIVQNIWPDPYAKMGKLPLLYFDDQWTYFAYTKKSTLRDYDFDVLHCPTGITLLRSLRLDTLHFHMENKMSFSDASSLFYFRPMMMCSDVETMHRYVPDFNKTEDWLQLVMHEYFHCFQFSHEATLLYLADSVGMAADTLDKIYVANNWFKEALQKENQFLLDAINDSSSDTMPLHISKFIATRKERRQRFATQSALNLEKLENFWETIEGTARYAEYYMAGKFSGIETERTENCDSLFRFFADYKGPDNFESKENFIQRTKMMRAYYYVTGFNLCRLMDKMKIHYKDELFDHPGYGLYEIFLNGCSQMNAE